MATSDVHAGGQHAATISRLVVQTFARFTGRGPVKARTQMSDDAIHVVLHDVLTTGEHNLVRAGHSDAVLASRAAIQTGIAQTLVAGVETITGRNVTAFLSANHIDPDMCVESFILEPLAE